MCDNYNENQEYDDYVEPEDEEDCDDEEEGFPVSESERAVIEDDIANKEAMVADLEENNDDGSYDDTISGIKNEISGLRYFLGE